MLIHSCEIKVDSEEPKDISKSLYRMLLFQYSQARTEYVLIKGKIEARAMLDFVVHKFIDGNDYAS